MEAATKIICDLYEMRASTIVPYRERREYVMDNFKYSFFTVAIATLADKYKVTDRMIENELLQRSLERELKTPVEEID